MNRPAHERQRCLAPQPARARPAPRHGRHPLLRPPLRSRGHHQRVRPRTRHAPLPLPRTAESPPATRTHGHRREHRTTQHPVSDRGLSSPRPPTALAADVQALGPALGLPGGERGSDAARRAGAWFAVGRWSVRLPQGALRKSQSKVAPYAAIRREHRSVMSQRALQRKYNVTWRMARKAQDSRWPEPRSSYCGAGVFRVRSCSAGRARGGSPLVSQPDGVTHRWMFRDRERSRPASPRIQVVSRFCLHLPPHSSSRCVGGHAGGPLVASRGRRLPRSGRWLCCSSGSDLFCPWPVAGESQAPLAGGRDEVGSGGEQPQPPTAAATGKSRSAASGSRQRDGGGAGRAGTSRRHLITPPLAPGLLDPGPAFGDGSWSRT